MICHTCQGPCTLATTGVRPSNESIIEDLRTCQERWHKNREVGHYFRAERWAKSRDVCLDHLCDGLLS